jgi:hypothetical protein
MLKTIKGKVIAGTVSVVLLSSAGAAFASQDASDNLKAWFDGQFRLSSKSVSDQSSAYVNGKVGSLVTEYNGLKTTATNSINTKAGDVKTSTNANVKGASDAYITDLNAEKAHIEGYLAGEFDSLSNFADGLIDNAGNAAVGYATRDLGSHASTAGIAATKQMTTDINFSTATAKSNLQAAIATAKFELQEDLNSETALTVTEIKRKIDAKIGELRIAITGINNGFIAKQKGNIEAAALVLEKAAKADLESVVDGI